MHTITGNSAASVTTSIQTVDNGVDKVDAATHNAFVQLAMDNDASMSAKKLAKDGDTTGNVTVGANKAITLTNETSKIKLGATGFARARARAVPISYAAASWSMDAKGVLTNSSSNNLSIVYQFEDVPDGSAITGADCFVNPPNGHVAVPAFVPRIEFWVTNIVTGVSTQLGSTELDPNLPADMTAYEAHHAIGVGGFSHDFDAATERLTLQLTSEGSTDALGGFKAIGCRLGYTQKHLET